MPEFDMRSLLSWRWPKGRAGMVLGVVLAVAVFGIASRIYNRMALGREANARLVLAVAVTKPTDTARVESLVLPGTVEAYTNAPIYARTNGYLKQWLVDIGAKVKAGQVLAVIDTPEVDQQLRQAEADLRTAETNERLAQSTADRWQALLAKGAVSAQAADERASDYTAKQALTASARANVQRLRGIQGFQRIVAPFDGTVTVRNVDVGQLVSSGNTQELFHIADLRKLRIHVQIPQPFAPAMHEGLDANLQFSERPAQQFVAKIVRTADALDPKTRTLLVELEVDNADGELFPGSYTEVNFQIPVLEGTIRIPANALIYRSTGLSVATVGPAGQAVLKPIKVGRDFGTEIEVAAGLGKDEAVIVSPPDSLVDGTHIRVVQSAAESVQK